MSNESHPAASQRAMLAAEATGKQKRVAEQSGISVSSVRAARGIIAASPELAEQVKAGKLSLHAAQVALGLKRSEPSLGRSYARIRSLRAGLGLALLPATCGKLHAPVKVDGSVTS